MLPFVTRGAGEPIVLVHGFTQSSQTWGRAGDLLAEARTTVALDAPGHGRAAGVEAGLEDGADLMAATVRSQGLRRPAWLGYSMGGRFALHVALRHPATVGALVLVSATAGIDNGAERGSRRRSDGALAERVVTEGLEPFVRWWLTQPIFATLPAEASQFGRRLDGSAEGLASSLRLAGTGTQKPLWYRLHELEMPVLVVAGELDRKYAGLAQRMATAVGANATVAIIAGAGHACHLEKPGEFAATVLPWLDALRHRPTG